MGSAWRPPAAYSSGPTGDTTRDATHAEQVVWDSYPGRFGGVEVVQESGGCVGPVCGSSGNEVASATYAQLANAFGPRPHGLDQATGHLPGWVTALFIVVPVLIVAAVVFAIVMNVRHRRRKRNRQAGPGAPLPPGYLGQPWQPGPPPPWQAGG